MRQWCDKHLEDGYGDAVLIAAVGGLVLLAGAGWWTLLVVAIGFAVAYQP